MFTSLKFSRASEAKTKEGVLWVLRSVKLRVVNLSTTDDLRTREKLLRW